MAIAALLDANPSPSNEDMTALPNICRCGAYPRIRRAIVRAAQSAAAANAERTAPKRLILGSSDEEHKSP
jgi:isoquinoline 1-oxidoreductase alpha subunit